MPWMQTLGVNLHGAGVMPPCSGITVPEKQCSNRKKAGNQLERPETALKPTLEPWWDCSGEAVQRVARGGGSWHRWLSPRFSGERKGVSKNGLCSDPGFSGKVQLRAVVIKPSQSHDPPGHAVAGGWAGQGATWLWGLAHQQGKCAQRLPSFHVSVPHMHTTSRTLSVSPWGREGAGHA